MGFVKRCFTDGFLQVGGLVGISWLRELQGQLAALLENGSLQVLRARVWRQYAQGVNGRSGWGC